VLPTVLKVLLSAWLVAVAVWDRVEQRIPNALVLPALGAVGVWRIHAALRGRTLAPLGGMLLAWGVVLALWRWRVWGAGDAKLLMVLFGLFPNASFALLLAGVFVVCEVACMRARGGRAGPQSWRTRSHPDAWMPALAGLLYLWGRC